MKLDAVVTVADAFHLEKQLEAQKEVNEQIAFADILLLNKTELVEASDIERVEARIRKINPYTKIIHTAHCDVPLMQVVGLDAFSVERVLEIEPDLLNISHGTTITMTMVITSIGMTRSRACRSCRMFNWIWTSFSAGLMRCCMCMAMIFCALGVF